VFASLLTLTLPHHLDQADIKPFTYFFPADVQSCTSNKSAFVPKKIFIFSTPAPFHICPSNYFFHLSDQRGWSPINVYIIMAPGIVSEEAALAVVAATNGVAADEPKKAEDVVNGVKAGISSEPNGELVNGITTEKAAETADVSEKSKEDAANGAETSHISDSASIKKDEKSAETKTDDDKAEEKKDEKKEPPKPQQVLVTLEVNPANGNVVVKEAKAKPPSQNFLLTLEVDPNGEVIVKKTKPDEKKDETKSDSKVDDTKKDADKEKGNEKEKDNTMKYEIKYLDRKYDDKDEPYFTERKTEEKQTEKSQPDWWQLYAFCIVRHYDYSNESVETTSMYVNAPQLRKLLADVIGNYPGHPIDEDEVQISAPYWPLFHYRKQIEEEGMKRFADDEQARKGLTLLLEWIDTHFKDEFAAFERCLSHEHHAIAYEHLWTLYPPNTIIYCKILNQNRAFRLNSCWYGCEPSFVARMEYVDFDGERIGLRHWELDISAYQGALEVADMTFMPFNLLEDADEVREELLTRGRKFEEYAHSQPKFMAYDAVALKRTHNGYAKLSVNGRVMVDPKTFHRMDTSDSFCVAPIGEPGKKDRGRSKRRRCCAPTIPYFAGDEDNEGKHGNEHKREYEKLNDEDIMLANATIRGYSFAQKVFLEFYVDELKEIEWNTKCFDGLVLDPTVKKTVQALVSMHNKRRDAFDDIVKGKGKGLVCVLHGPPGVGKTLTAECVAEFVKRPLYMVSSGDCMFPPLLYPTRMMLTLNSGNLLRGPGPQAHPNHGPRLDLARRPSHRRSRCIPGTARPARPAPQRHGLRLPSRPRVLQRHPLPDHQPRQHLRRRLQIANPHSHPLHRADRRVAHADLAQFLQRCAWRCRYRREGAAEAG